MAKIDEQIELLRRLIRMVPEDKLEWRPIETSFKICELLGHLLEAVAGFCAALYAVHPQKLSYFLELRSLPVNHCCGIVEVQQRIEQYRTCIQNGFALVTDDDLILQVPTVFKPEGEALITILLGNLEHLINHKHLLFFYLKLIDIPITSKDLYQFRE
ncbi:DinB family protein [bacterium]|nr:DinB family protein [bacterium]